jgi:hypothetical protein
MKVTLTVITFAVVLFCFGLYSTRDLNCNETIRQDQILIDSLRDENFILQIEAGRYDAAIEILKDRDSLAYIKFDSILTNETE